MNPDTMTPFTIRGYAVHRRRDNGIDYAFPVEEMEVRTHTFWESEVRRLNECITREALMLLSRQDAREEEEEENDDDGDNTDNNEQNMSEHTNPNEDVDSEPEWIDTSVLGAEAIQGNDVAAVETEPVNQEGETSASVKGRMSDEYSVIRKRRTKRKMETGKNRMEDAVTVQTLPISEDEIREDDSCGTIGKQKRRKMRTLGDIMSCSTPTSNGGGPQGSILSPTSSEGAPLGTGLSPMTSSGGAPMEISLSPSTSTGGDTLGMNLDPSTLNGGGAPLNDLNSSNSSGGFALGFDLNELPPDQAEDWISPQPTAAEGHAEGEVQGTSVNDQTVVQSEASQWVQKEHSNAESSIVQPKKDEAGRTVVHSVHRTLPDEEQMFQIVNGKLPLHMPGSPTQRPSILLRGSGRQGHIAAGNQGKKAYGRNAASGTTDPLVRNLHRSTIEAQRTVGTSKNLISTEPPAAENHAGGEVQDTSVIDQTVSSSKGKGKVGLPSTFEPQPAVGRSSNYYGNQSLSYTSPQEIAATRSTNFHGCSSGAGAYQRTALPSSPERPFSGSHFPLGASSPSGRGAYQQLHALVGGSSSIIQPGSQESWRNSERLSYRSQPPAGSLANQGQRFSQSCFGKSQGFQTSQSSMSQNSLYHINQCLRMGLEASMRSPPQHIYSGTDRRVHPNASLPTDMLRYRTPIHVDRSNNIHQLSSMPRDYHRLDMSRLAHLRSNGPLIPQSTSSYLNGDNYPGSFTGMSPVPQSNSASFPSVIRPHAIPVPEPILPPAIPVPEQNLPHAVSVPGVCRTNENPAEFNTPEIRNKHMTGYGDVQQR